MIVSFTLTFQTGYFEYDFLVNIFICLIQVMGHELTHAFDDRKN